MGYRTSPVAQGIPFDNSTNGFTATEVQAAILEAKNAAEGKVRFSIQLLNNGIVGDGQRMGYSELHGNTPVIMPRNCILREVTFANNSAISDMTFKFYVRTVPSTTTTTTGLTAFNTWVITNSLTATLSGLSQAFNAGEECLIIAVDTGDNPNDAVITLFFQVA